MTAKSLEKRIYDIVYRNRSCYMDAARVRDTAADIMKEIDLDRRGINRVTPGGVEIPKSACSPDLTIAEVVTAHKAVHSSAGDVQKEARERAHAAMREHGGLNVLLNRVVDDEGKPFVRYKDVFKFMGDDALNIDPAVLHEEPMRQRHGDGVEPVMVYVGGGGSSPIVPHGVIFGGAEVRIMDTHTGRIHGSDGFGQLPADRIT